MSKRYAKRVLLVGWDAADWNFLDPLLKAGKMPALQQLIDNGVRGNLATIRPVLSPMLWNSIATGKRADKHGILSFVEPQPDASGVRPVTSTSRQCKALWNILSQNGLESAVVNWFASHPAEPIKGSIVTDRFEHLATQADPAKASVEGAFHPPGLADTLVDMLVKPEMLDGNSLGPFLPRGSEIDQDTDDRVKQLAQLVAKTSSVHAAACHVARGETWDMMAVYYGGIDQFGHYFMPYHPPAMPGVDPRDVELYGEVMEACYRFHDMMLSSLLTYAGPDTTVVLVSDHGFHHGTDRPSADGMEDPMSWHRAFGVACVSGPGIDPNTSLYGGTLLDVTPTILTALGLPVGMDMDGRAWAEVFADPEPIKKIISWDTVEGDDGMHPEGVREDPAIAAEAIRQLVDLGYMDAPSDDAQATIDKCKLEHQVNLALALADSQRAHKAIPILEDLAARDDEQQGSYLVQLAVCQLKSGDLEGADITLDRIDGPARQNDVVAMLKARIALAQGRHDAALQILTTLESQNPDRADIAQSLAVAYLQLERYDEAEVLLNRCANVDDLAATSLHGLSQIALARGQTKRAIDLSLQAVGLIHFFPDAHVQLARALVAAGRPDEARQAAEVALQLRPGLKPAHRLLADIGDSDTSPAWQHDMLGQS